MTADEIRKIKSTAYDVPADIFHVLIEIAAQLAELNAKLQSISEYYGRRG